MNVWIVVFLAGALPMASGPHTLDNCLILAGYQTTSHCFNIQTGERKKP